VVLGTVTMLLVALLVVRTGRLRPTVASLTGPRRRAATSARSTSLLLPVEMFNRPERHKVKLLIVVVFNHVALGHESPLIKTLLHG